MRVYVLLAMLAIVFIFGCLGAENIERTIDEAVPSANYDLLKIQYDSLVDNWEENVSTHTFVLVDNYTVTFPSSLSVANTSCKNAMKPAFDCEDLVIETNDVSNLKTRDIVSFTISEDEAQFFGERDVAGAKLIYRRIHDIVPGGYVMKADTFDEPHVKTVSVDRIKSRVVAVFYDGMIEEKEIPVSTATDFEELQEDYQELFDAIQNLYDSVFVVQLKNFEIYVDREVSSVSLACTGSMLPTLDCGDIVIERPVAEGEMLEVDDAISFTNFTAFYLQNDPRSIILHRIFRIEENENGFLYVTKGDNNRLTDAKVPEDKIRGKVIGVFFREDGR